MSTQEQDTPGTPGCTCRSGAGYQQWKPEPHPAGFSSGWQRVTRAFLLREGHLSPAGEMRPRPPPASPLTLPAGLQCGLGCSGSPWALR